MAQALEAASYALYAGRVGEGTGDTEPPDMQDWNWHPLDEHGRKVVNDALAASREAGAGLLAGLIR